MGAGRRTQSHGSYLDSAPASFLMLPPSHLASVIFGCTHSTYDECVQQLLFGLPSAHIAYVRNVRPRMPLFLFNYSDRKLHGIFEADSHGALNIDPYGWAHHGSEKTQFPAQVRVRVKHLCSPLPEKIFKDAIADNYYGEMRFHFELNHVQTNALVDLFTKNVKGSRKLTGGPVSQKSECENAWSNPKNSVKFLMAEHYNAPPFEPAATRKSGSCKGKNAIPELCEGKNATLNNRNTLCENVSDDKLESEIDPAEEVEKEKQQKEYEILEKLKQLQTGKTQDNVEIKYEVPHTQETVKSDSATSADTLLNKRVDSDLLEWERMARERCLQEQTMLREERERVKEILQSLDVIVARSITKNLEICSSAIAQMRQNEIELRQVMDQASPFARIAVEFDELRKRNAVLEYNQVQMASELESLKLEVRQLSENQIQETVLQDYDLDADPEETQGPMDQIYILGGHDGQSWLETVHVLSPDTQHYSSVASMLAPRSYAASCVLKGQIYVFGGGDGRSWYETVETYDSTADAWINCAPMRSKRGSLAGVANGDRIFAIGGGYAQVSLSDVECYDPHLEIWVTSTSMLSKRFGVAAAELDGALYAIGGYDDRVYLASVERFDPREALWTAVASMNRKRGFLSAAALGGKIYAIGGYDGSEFLSSMEVYEPRMNSWLQMESRLHQGRAYGAAARIGDSIYMIGGRNVGVRNDGPYVDKVERYTESTGWEVIGYQFIGGRCFLSCAVLQT